MIYLFEKTGPGTFAGEQRNLPDDAAAIEWMGREVIDRTQVLLAYREGETEPFARREFGGEVEVR